MKQSLRRVPMAMLLGISSFGQLGGIAGLRPELSAPADQLGSRRYINFWFLILAHWRLETVAYLKWTEPGGLVRM